MKSATGSQWISVGANLGVLAGLILVAVQINQHASGVQSAAYQEWVAVNMELNMATSDPLLSTAMARGTGRSADLSEESFMAFAMWHQSFYQMAQATDYLYKQGDLDRQLWDVEMDRAAVHLELPGVREWWDAGAKTQLAPEFVELMESRRSGSTRWDWDAQRGFHAMEPGR